MSEMTLQKTLYLIGFMGCGKSTVSRYLAEQLQVERIEMDDILVAEAGKPITQIFAEDGEAVFRQMETALVGRLGQGSPVIVSCGGGVVLREENVKLMKEQGTILMLEASPETIYDRVKNSTKRPILNGHMNVEYIAQLLEKREPYYKAAADHIVCVDGKTSQEVACYLAEHIGEL